MAHLHPVQKPLDLKDEAGSTVIDPTRASTSSKISVLDPCLLRTPKLTPAEKRGLIYSYYAGFSEAFVTSILDRLGVTEHSRVLDPWNGSGTTTYAASVLGIRSTGYDINPALTVVAAARASTLEDLANAQVAWGRLRDANDDADAPAVDQCVKLYHRLVAGNSEAGRGLRPGADALILCALFDTLRKNFQHARTRNPAWFSSKSGQAPIVSFADIANAASASFSSLVERQSRSAGFIRRTPDLRTCDFLQLAPERASFDTVITSPPYLTRLDYVKATLPELSLLASLRGTDIHKLRTRMMGSPLVGSTAPPVDPRWGATAVKLVEQVRTHPSKASATYYSRFFLKYFDHLQTAQQLLHKLLTPGGKGCLVVQSSQYKEIFVDLPRIVAEMSETAGFSVTDTFDFIWNRSIVSINSRASVKASRSVIESAVMIEKR